MATIGAISVNVTATTAELTRQLRQGQRNIRAFSRSAQRSFNELSSRAATSLKWITGGLVAGGLAAMKTFADEAEVMTKLKTTLDALGQGNHYQALVEHASALQAITRYGDDANASLMTLGLNMGIGVNQIQQATNAAIGLATAYNMDLNTSMKMIALATQGEYTMLGRYIPELRTATSETEKMRIVNEAAARGFQIEQDAARTTAGQLVQLKNAVGDLVEMIGQRLLGTLDGGNSLLGTMIQHVTAATMWVESLTDSQIGLIKTWAGIGLGILAFLALVPKVVGAVKFMIGAYRALAAAQALSNPWLAAAGVAAATAVMGATAYLGGLVDETLNEFSGSWDRAMNKAEERVKGIQANAETALQRADRSAAAPVESSSNTLAAQQARSADATKEMATKAASAQNQQLEILRQIEKNTRSALKMQF